MAGTHCLVILSGSDTDDRFPPMLPVIRAAAFWMGIPRQVRVPGGRLHLGVAQHHTHLFGHALSRLSWTCL